METLRIALKILSGSLILASIMPLIRNDHWTFRIFEFPRFQKWVINIGLVAAYLLTGDFTDTADLVFIVLLLANFSYLTYQIAPYFPFAKKQIQDAGAKASPHIKLLIYNVYQPNRKFDSLHKLVDECDAHLVLMVETNAWWEKKSLEGFGHRYPHQVLCAQENTYGLLIFSKFALHQVEVRHLVKEEVPSVSMQIALSDTEHIQFYAIHPEPPVPGENPYSTDRDAEILIIGKEAEQQKLPVIVAGDLNDVAWSYTSELFMKISKLLDPRRGRGFFSSYHAKYPFLRWPLDHIFCSAHFRVRTMKRLKAIGSDHFPIFIDLHLHGREDHREGLEAEEEDEAQAREKIVSAL